LTTKEDFIQNLADQMEPVNKVFVPKARFTLWLLISVVSICAVMLFIQGFRPNFLQQLGWNRFTVETLFSFLPILSSGYVVYLLAIPGLRISPLQVVGAFVPFFIFVGILIYGLIDPSLPPSMEGKRAFCVHEILVLSWIAVGFAIWQLRRGFPTRPMLSGLLVGLASSSIPLALMQVACMYDAKHVLLFHVIPAVVVILLATLIGSRFIKPREF
jgi:hypothetical protein